MLTTGPASADMAQMQQNAADAAELLRALGHEGRLGGRIERAALLQEDGVGQGGRALAGDELHAVVLGRVVARGYLERAVVAPLLGRPGDDGGRCVPLGEDDVEPVGTEHAGQFLGEPARGLAGVVADDDRTVVAAVAERRRQRLADDAHPRFGEHVECRSPAVCPETYRCSIVFVHVRTLTWARQKGHPLFQGSKAVSAPAPETNASFAARDNCLISYSRDIAADFDSNRSTWTSSTGVRPRVYFAPSPSSCSRTRRCTSVV